MERDPRMEFLERPGERGQQRQRDRDRDTLRRRGRDNPEEEAGGHTDIRHRRRRGDPPETKSPAETRREPAPEGRGHPTAQETEAAHLGARSRVGGGGGVGTRGPGRPNHKPGPGRDRDLPAHGAARGGRRHSGRCCGLEGGRWRGTRWRLLPATAPPRPGPPPLTPPLSLPLHLSKPSLTTGFQRLGNLTCGRNPLPPSSYRVPSLEAAVPLTPLLTLPSTPHL